jgi:hypothetical protein
MPRWCVPIIIDGKVVGSMCGSSPTRYCSCKRRATIQCDYPAMRAGKAGTCDRWCCRSCSTHVGPDKDYCAVHAHAAAHLEQQQTLPGIGDRRR